MLVRRALRVTGTHQGAEKDTDTPEAGKAESAVDNVCYLSLHKLELSMMSFYLLLSHSMKVTPPDSPIVAPPLSLGTHGGVSSSLGATMLPSVRVLRHGGLRTVRERPEAALGDAASQAAMNSESRRNVKLTKSNPAQRETDAPLSRNTATRKLL